MWRKCCGGTQVSRMDGELFPVAIGQVMYAVVGGQGSVMPVSGLPVIEMPFREGNIIADLDLKVLAIKGVEMQEAARNCSVIVLRVTVFVFAWWSGLRSSSRKNAAS